MKASELVEAANQAGGKDNITVVLVHNNKLPSKHEVTKPPAILKNTIELPAEDAPVQLSEVEPNNMESPEEQKKPGRGLIMLLLFLCVIFFAGFAWFFMKNREKENGRLGGETRPSQVSPNAWRPAQQQAARACGFFLD